MSLLALMSAAFANAVLLMIDMVTLLLLIRVACSYKRIAVLAEFDQAGKPLVDRVMRYTMVLWCRFVPNWRVTVNGQLFVTWVMLLATRLCVMALIHVVV